MRAARAPLSGGGKNKKLGCRGGMMETTADMKKEAGIFNAGRRLLPREG